MAQSLLPPMAKRTALLWKKNKKDKRGDGSLFGQTRGRFFVCPCLLKSLIFQGTIPAFDIFAFISALGKQRTVPAFAPFDKEKGE